MPKGIVAFLELKPGSKLEWKMEIENGERIVKVLKAPVPVAEDAKTASKRAKPR